MNYRYPFLAAAVITSIGAALIAYVLSVDIQDDEATLTEKS